MYVCADFMDRNVLTLPPSIERQASWKREFGDTLKTKEQKNAAFRATKRASLLKQWAPWWNVSKPILLEKNPWMQLVELHELLPKPSIQAIVLRHPLYWRNAHVRCGQWRDNDLIRKSDFEQAEAMWCLLGWMVAWRAALQRAAARGIADNVYIFRFEASSPSPLPTLRSVGEHELVEKKKTSLEEEEEETPPLESSRGGRRKGRGAKTSQQGRRRRCDRPALERGEERRLAS